MIIAIVADEENFQKTRRFLEQNGESEVHYGYNTAELARTGMYLLIVIRSLLFLLSLKYKGVSKTFFYSGIATLGPVEALLPYTVDSFSFVNSVTLKLLLNFAFLYFRLWPSFACTLVVLLARVASYVYFNEVEVSGLLVMQVCCNLFGSAAIMILIHLAFNRLRRLIT